MSQSLSSMMLLDEQPHQPAQGFTLGGTSYASAMVTSTSTPGSMEMEVICLTISEGECKSMTRLWILIWNLSQVLEPSPQGVFRVVILRVLVGILVHRHVQLSVRVLVFCIEANTNADTEMMFL